MRAGDMEAALISLDSPFGRRLYWGQPPPFIFFSPHSGLPHLCHSKSKESAMFAGSKRFTVLALLVCAFSIVGCNVDELPYETACNHDELEALSGQQIVLVPFEYEPLMLAADTLDAETAATIRDSHQAYFSNLFGEYFDIVEVTEPGQWLADGGAELAQIIAATDADGAILVTNSYGYDLSSGDSILGEAAGDAVEGVLGSLVSEKAGTWFQGLSGPTFISDFYLASDTQVVNRDGEVVWRFSGKALGHPAPLSGTVGEELETLARSTVGGDPTAGELERGMEDLYRPYTDYLVWVLDRDLEQDSGINYFTDYPAADDKGFGIFPANDETHIPKVRSAEEIVAYEEAVENNIVTVMKTSEWRTFGQWKQAWAALKVLGLALLIGMPLAWLDDRIQPKSDEAEGCMMLQLLMFGCGVGMMAGLYFLLRAVL